MTGRTAMGDEFLTACALVLVIEGLLYAVLPDTMRRAMLEALKQPSSTIRPVGVAAAATGVGLIWLLRR